MEKLSVQDLAMFIGCQMEYVTPNGKTRISLNTFWLNEINSIISIDLCKPILRPLSDITEEDKLKMLKLEYSKLKINSVEWSLDIFYNAKVEYYSDINEWMPTTMKGYLKLKPYSEINFKYLISKHFDVFMWIEKGLAIKKENNDGI